MFCFAHIPKNFFARFARDPPSGGSAFGRVGVVGGGIKYCSASRARLEIIFRRSPKKSFALHGRSKSEISTGFFLRLVDGSFALRQRGKAPEPQAQLGEVDLKVDRTLAFQATIAIVSMTTCLLYHTINNQISYSMVFILK